MVLRGKVLTGVSIFDVEEVRYAADYLESK